MTKETTVDIDWSTAPSDATHYSPENDAMPWRAHFDECWHGWNPEEENWVEIENPMPMGYIARPRPWYGVEPIQVGMTCKLKGRIYTLVGIHDGYGWVKTGEFGFQTAKLSSLEPVKSKAERAAEARQAQIDQILADAGVTDSAFNGDPEAEAWAAALLDAGYRKVEGADE